MLKLIRHEAAKDVRVERHVMAPDKIDWDVVLDNEKAFAEHEEAECAGTEGDANDEVWHACTDEAHETFSREERCCQDSKIDTEPIQPCQWDYEARRDKGDEKDARNGACDLREDVGRDSIRSVAALAKERGALDDEEREDRD